VQNERNGIRNFAKIERMKTVLITVEKGIRRVRNNLPRV
jgi:hypothetical protein